MNLRRSIFQSDEINKAGRVLASTDYQAGEPDDEWVEAAHLVDAWRASHSRPLNTFQVNLRRKVGQRGFVVRRLKRLPSIVGKLTRLPWLQLSKMQDIGGCRAVVRNSDGAFNPATDLVDSRIRHELIRYSDYITRPRPTGYRSIHLVYAYFSDRTADWQGVNVEIQIRSRLQHQWATAVETVGTFIGDDLKSNEGDPTWLRFFALMSTVIALGESTPPVPGTPTGLRQLVEEIKDCDEMLGVSDRLIAFQQITRQLQPQLRIRDHWVVLELNLGTSSATGYAFGANELTDATSFYLDKELENRANSQVDVVMVSASSMSALRRAYPNYFADLSDFRELFRRTLAT